MSIDDDLPTELNRIEGELRQLSLVATGVDRDATMYDAGWAAADSLWKSRSQRARDSSVWRITTGVLAASVALLALLLVQRDSPVPRGEPVVVERPTGQVQPSTESQRREFPMPRRGLATSRWSSGTSLLSRRELALREALSDVPQRPDNVALPVGQIKSARELLREYLPSQRGES